MSATSDQDLERWRALVERGLKGAPFDSLVAETLEGLRIRPLYTERDRPAEEGIPWAPRSPRLIGPATAVAAQLGDQRREGASFVWLWSERAASEVPGVTTVVASAAPEPDAAQGSRWVRPILDPWVSRVFDAGEDRPPADLRPIASAASSKNPALGVATWRFREEGGADAIDELALTTASLVESLRALETRGVSLDDVVDGTTIGVAVGPEFFLEIAKLRALRRLVDRVLASCGITTRPFVASVTSIRHTSLIDPAVNILRNTLSASAALIGGADAVAVHGHDLAPSAGASVMRLARNLPLVLALESCLGELADPARGSFYVEQLTSELVASAWERFRDIERDGGLVRARERVRTWLAASAEKRSSAVRRRRRPLVGLSKFPASGARRFGTTDALPFERLRCESEGLVARVITVGACPPARVDFAREILAVSGLPDPVHAFTDDAAAALGDASIVILAGPDAALAVEIPAVARALRSAGAKAIGVAAKPGAHEAALRDAGVDAFVFLGADVVTFGETLVERAKGAAWS